MRVREMKQSPAIVLVNGLNFTLLHDGREEGGILKLTSHILLNYFHFVDISLRMIY